MGELTTGGLLITTADVPPSADILRQSPWDDHSSHWDNIEPPLRPSAEDLCIVQSELNNLARSRETVRALMLGVTRELTAISWPGNSSLIAVDSSLSMLMRRWIPPANIGADAIQGSWNNLPVPSESFDLVLADGSLSILPNATGLADVMHQISKALYPGGRIVTRVFVRSEVEDSVGNVVDAMQRRRFRSFHVFKWRLVMALHDSTDEGVVLSQVYDTVNDLIPNRVAFASDQRWSLESINTIDAYRGVSGQYYFPRASEFAELSASNFIEVNRHFPTYELGERCPTFVLSRK